MYVTLLGVRSLWVGQEGMPDQEKVAVAKGENGIKLCMRHKEYFCVDGDLCRGKGREQVV